MKPAVPVMARLVLACPGHDGESDANSDPGLMSGAKRRGWAGRAARGEDERYLTRKGRASQIGPESCVSGREVWDEALTGVLVGQVLSRERLLGRGADACGVAAG